MIPEDTVISGIIGGFISKIINDSVDVSKLTIKKVIESKTSENENIQSQIYQVIINALNQVTPEKYKEDQDNIYDVAESLLKSLKNSKGDSIEAIKIALAVFDEPVNNERCEEFKILLYHEICERAELYREVSLIKQDQQINNISSVMHSIDEVKQIVTEIKENGINKRGVQKNKSQQIVKSRTKEYADKWNANMFLNDFDEWDENAGVNVKLKDVYTEEHLPHFIWGENKNVSYNLDVLLSKYIVEKSENKMLLILGQPGIGKSTLITWITQKFGKNIDDILVYQFASDLKNVNWQNSSFPKIILDRFRELNIDLNGKTLIFDGFDEISAGDNRKEILDCFYRYFMNKMDFNNLTIIITCRENYIRELERLKCKYIKLQSWNDKQIRSFCKLFADKTKCNISVHTIEHILVNKEILGIPLILYMVLALGIELNKESSIVDIYDKIFTLEGGIYDRCITNKSFADKHRIGRIKKQIHQVSREIAMWMFENNPDEASIPQEEYQKICIDVKKESGEENEEINRDFLIGNFFKLVKHCEGTETEELYFVHRTIYEYFVAEYIFSSIQETINLSSEKLAGVLGCLLKGNKLSIKILEFLKIKIENSKLNKEFDKVNNAFQLMLQDGMTYYTGEHYKSIFNCEMMVFSNMLEIIHLWNKECFKVINQIRDYLYYSKNYGLNLKGIQIIKDKDFIDVERLKLKKYIDSIYLRKAKLSGADLSLESLSRADLEEADLTEVNLTGSNLEGANMKKANLRKAKLVEANLQCADLRGADLRGVDLRDAQLGYADLSGSIWSIEDVLKFDTKFSEADFESIIVFDGSNRKKSLNRKVLLPDNIHFEKKALDF